MNLQPFFKEKKLKKFIPSPLKINIEKKNSIPEEFAENINLSARLVFNEDGSASLFMLNPVSVDKLFVEVAIDKKTTARFLKKYSFLNPIAKDIPVISKAFENAEGIQKKELGSILYETEKEYLENLGETTKSILSQIYKSTGDPQLSQILSWAFQIAYDSWRAEGKDAKVFSIPYPEEYKHTVKGRKHDVDLFLKTKHLEDISPKKLSLKVKKKDRIYYNALMSIEEKEGADAAVSLMDSLDVLGGFSHSAKLDAFEVYVFTIKNSEPPTSILALCDKAISVIKYIRNNKVFESYDYFVFFLDKKIVKKKPDFNIFKEIFDFLKLNPQSSQAKNYISKKLNIKKPELDKILSDISDYWIGFLDEKTVSRETLDFFENLVHAR
ncbi:hypothetical protein JXB01_00455 [Candidatus Micrarchaeota archaeon]|nr:hypothetical protein [Candidatus Micrarchaeota archaeon]